MEKSQDTYIQQEENHCRKKNGSRKEHEILEFFSPQILRQINSSNFRIAKTSHVAKGRVFETLELLNLNSHKIRSEEKYSIFHFSVHGRCKKMSMNDSS